MSLVYHYEGAALSVARGKDRRSCSSCDVLGCQFPVAVRLVAMDKQWRWDPWSYCQGHRHIGENQDLFPRRTWKVTEEEW